MLTKTKTLVSASILAIAAAPVLADSPRVGISTEEAMESNENFAVQGSAEVGAPRFEDEVGDKTVDVESTNREMGVMQVSELGDYLRPDMQLTDSPLLGTAVMSSDEKRVGFISEVYQTPEGDQVAVANIDESLNVVTDQFALRVANGAGSVSVPMDSVEFTNTMQAIDGGERSE